MLKAFFSYFGAKNRHANKYPSPIHGTIIEPFAGSAGYSVRYANRNVILVEKDPAIAGCWDWLIHVSSEEVLRLPVDLDSCNNLERFVTCPEARYFMRLWFDPGVGKHARSKPSKRMREQDSNSSKCWGSRIRQRIASQVPSIRHWRIFNCGYEDIPWFEIRHCPITWFVDPPYQYAGKGYVHGSGSIDFSHLADFCKSVSGQVIVCEHSGARWLPFDHLYDLRGIMRQHSGKESEEGIWYQERSEPLL
jgi:site-specific DNA-adenine methylase